MTSAPPERKLQLKNPVVEKPDGFFQKKSCIIRKSDNLQSGALIPVQPSLDLLVPMDGNGDGAVTGYGLDTLLDMDLDRWPVYGWQRLTLTCVES